MDVILDANVYLSLVHSHGGGFAKANVFVELITYLRRTKDKLVIPAPVLEEVTARYGDLLRQSAKEADDRWTTLKRNATTLLPDINLPKVAAEVEAFKERLLKPSQGFQSKLYDSYAQIPLSEVVRRGVYRVRPANEKGEELRDVVIWLLVLEYAKEMKRSVAFISNDKVFRGQDDKLHQLLVDEAEKKKVKILYYNSISQFIADNSLAVAPAIAEEMDSLIPADEFARLLIEIMIDATIKQGTIRNVEIFPTKFQEGQKYRVADDSFYIEARYSGEVRLVVEQSFVSLNAIGVTGYAIPATGFHSSPYLNYDFFTDFKTPNLLSTIAQAMPAINPGSFQAAVPQPTKTMYQCTFDAHVSLRTIGAKRESLEVDRIQLRDMTPVRENTPMRGSPDAPDLPAS